VLQDAGASSCHAEDRVRRAELVERRDAIEARLGEVLDIALEAIRRRADHYERHSVSLSRRASFSGTPTATISSTGASRMACTDRNWRNRARLRAGPMPSIESSGEDSALRERTLR